MLKYCVDRYKTQEMFDKTVDTCVQTLTFVPDWFVMSKIIDKLDNVVFSDDYIVFGDIDSDIW